MAFWLAIVCGLVVGTALGGWKAVSLAKDDNYLRANRWLRAGCWTTVVVVLGMMMALRGWPFVTKIHTAMDEVTRTVTEAVEVPVEVTSWYFWTDTEIHVEERQKTVVDMVPSTTTTRHLSFVLLAAMGLFGAVAYQLEAWTVRLLWRFWG